MESIIWNIKSYDELSVPEFHDLIKARISVFIVEQNCPYPDLDDTDQKALHLWATLQGEVVAYCRIFNSRIKYPEASIGRVLTTEKGRGKSTGKTLMKLAIQTIESRFRTSEIRISAQDYLIQFYSEFGFQDTGKKYLEDNIPHTEMFRK